MLPPQSAAHVADMQSSRTRCGNRLHPACQHVEEANVSSRHEADMPSAPLNVLSWDSRITLLVCERIALAHRATLS
jgi:hypothetical protein